MTFYQELQLDQTGSKAHIASFKTPKEKFKHILIYLFKICINILFSTLFIVVVTILLGSENSIVGLVLLLAVMVFRVSDLDIHASHSIPGIFIIFAIYAIGPKVSNLVPVGFSFCVNIICIMLLLLVGCHNVKLFNHCNLILSYLFLEAYDVSGDAYKMRLVGLSVGAVIVSIILYHNHRKIKYEYGFKDLFTDITLASERFRWQIRFTLGISSLMLIAHLIGLTKPAWIGIAAMSVCAPFQKSVLERVKFRAPANLLASLAFIVIYILLPDSLHGFMGVLGGIGTGLSATYSWQTACNAFSSLATATPLLGLPTAVIYRVINNTVGSIYIYLFDMGFERLLLYIYDQSKKITSRFYARKAVYIESTENRNN